MGAKLQERLGYVAGALAVLAIGGGVGVYARQGVADTKIERIEADLKAQAVTIDKINVIENDVSYIKEDVTEIKNTQKDILKAINEIDR